MWFTLYCGCKWLRQPEHWTQVLLSSARYCTQMLDVCLLNPLTFAGSFCLSGTFMNHSHPQGAPRTHVCRLYTPSSPSSMDSLAPNAPDIQGTFRKTTRCRRSERPLTAAPPKTLLLLPARHLYTTPRAAPTLLCLLLTLSVQPL